MRGPVAAVEVERGGGDTVDSALRVVADGLTARGFDILVPADQGPCQLFLTDVRGALCELALTAKGTMVWTHRPFYGASVSPQTIAGMVMALLGSPHAPGHEIPLQPCSGLGLKEAMGRTLAACGLQVCLKVIYRDDENYEIYSAIEVTNPAQLPRGTVQVGDDAAIRWECGSGALATGGSGLLAADVAQVIAKALTGQTS